MTKKQRAEARRMFLDGEPVEQIAKVLGVPVTAVEAVLVPGAAKQERSAAPPAPRPPEAPQPEASPTYPRTIGEIASWLNPGAQPAPRIHGEYAAVGRRSCRTIR